MTPMPSSSNSRSMSSNNSTTGRVENGPGPSTTPVGNHDRADLPNPDNANLGIAQCSTEHAHRGRTFKGRLRGFAALPGQTSRDRTHGDGTEVPLPVMVIPAPERGMARTPDSLLASSRVSVEARSAVCGLPPAIGQTPSPAIDPDHSAVPERSSPCQSAVPTAQRRAANSPNSSQGGGRYQRGMLVISEERPDRNG